MVNANEKWEAVEPSDLKAGDAVRLTHDNGNVIHGEMYKDGRYIEAGIIGHWASRYKQDGYRFERAVPERTLPTEPGLYVAASEAVPSDVSARVYWMPLGGSGFYDYSTEGIQYVQERDVPDDLVRLVPVAEVEAAERRNHEAWHALEDYRRIGGQSFHRIITDIQNILGGKSKP